MAATQLVSSASAGDQSTYGTGKVENAAFGVYVPGIDAAAIPRPVVSSQSRQVFDFTVAKSWDGRLDFSVSPRPVTSVGGIDSYVFGTTSIVNAAQSFTPVGIPPSAIGVPITAATSGVILNLTEVSTQSVSHNFNWGPSLFIPHGFDSSVFGQNARIDAPLTARPVGIAPSAPTTGLPRFSDPSISGYRVEFNLTEFGLPNATPSSINFVFGGAAVIVPASWLSSVVGTSTDGRNAAATIAPLGLPPTTYQAPYPVVWYSDSSGRVDFDLTHVQTQTGANVAFTFWVARAALAIGWESFEPGTAVVASTNPVIYPLGIFSQEIGSAAIGYKSGASTVQTVGIPPTSVVSSPTIYLKTRYVLPPGLDSSIFGYTTAQNWIRYLTPTGADQSEYGNAVLTHDVRALSPYGFDSVAIGTPSIDNKTRYYNLLGWTSSVVAVGARVWDGTQYVVNATLGESTLIDDPIVSFPVAPPDDTQSIELSGHGIPTTENQVWPLHSIENRTKQAFPDGFTSYGLGSPYLEQTIYITMHPLGADWSVFGTPFVDQTIKKLFTEGFTSEFVPASHQIYNYNTDVVAGGLNSYVSGAHTVLRGAARPVVNGIAPTSVVSTNVRIWYRVRTLDLTDFGFDTSQFGTAILQDRNLWVYPGGIAPTIQTSKPVVDYRTRLVTGAGSIEAGTIPNTHIVTPWVQYVSVQDKGIPSPGVGTGNIQFRHREIFPTFVIGPYWGTTTVKRRIFVEPSGWDSSFISENAELLINTRRVYVYTGEADQAEYGVANVFNWRQDIDLYRNGWYDTQWNFPVIYNLTREIVVAPFAENINPEQWPNYQPHVENKNRTLSTFGHSSSRVGLSTWIHNNAVPAVPEGTDMTLWGAGTFIAYRNRTVQPQGWDSFYNERYTVIWNKADVLGPAGVGDTSAFGRPDPVANLNREIKQHSGWVGPEWGVPFIAFARRFVTPGLFYDVPAAFPEVRLNPFPIVPVGIPWQGQVGGHEVRIFRRETFPKSTNVHSTEWVGEPIVKNRNLEVGPYGYDHSEFGRPDIQNFIRYVAPEWVSPDNSATPLISYRTRTINAATITAPVFTVLHRVRKDSPDPPSLQRIVLVRFSPNGEELDGLGIAPPGMGTPDTKLATIYPEGIDETAKFGKPKAYSTNIMPKFMFEDGLFGIPILTFTQDVYAKGWDNGPVVSGGIRMTPWNIYAPKGDQMPPGYTPRRDEAHAINSMAVFGSPTVSNQYRTIGPVPARYYDSGGPWFDAFPKLGVPAFEHRLRYVSPYGIRSNRFGQVIFLNVPQYVNLDEEFDHQGIAPSTQWGWNAIHYPPVPPLVDRPVYPMGFSATLWGNTNIELFNRTIYATGIPHRGNPQQGYTSPWGVPMVGYPRRYTIGMGVQTLWGNTLIEFKNRPVYPVGWNNCSLEDGNFDNFRFPMKVIRVNPPVRVPAVQSGAVFGTCTVSHHIRTVYSRCVNGYNSGSHSVKASSTIGAQGWESLLIGDIDRWEAGKIKAHGDDMSTVGTPRLLHPLRPSGFDSSGMATPNAARCLSPIGVPNIAFDGPSVTNPFGCTNRVMTPLPIISTQTVPSPVVA